MWGGDAPGVTPEKFVGLSNKLEEELDRRKELEGPHREVVGAAIVNRALFLKIVQGEEGVVRIESFLVFFMATLHLAVVLSAC